MQELAPPYIPRRSYVNTSKQGTSYTPYTQQIGVGVTHPAGEASENSLTIHSLH